MDKPRWSKICADEFCSLIRKICSFSPGWSTPIIAVTLGEKFGEHRFIRAYYNHEDEQIYLESESDAEVLPLVTIQTQADTVEVPTAGWSGADRVSQHIEDEKLWAEQENAASIRAEKKDRLREVLSPYLGILDLLSVDKKAETLSNLEDEIFLEVKVERVLRFLSERINPILHNDIEKAIVLSQKPGSMLVRARAGSGKTTLLGAQTILLSEGYKFKPSEILVLAFNRAASQEIGERIREQYDFPGFHHARTFHSLAYNIVKPEEQLLFDEDRSFYGEKHKNFIADTMRSIMSIQFKSKLMTYFRKELAEIEEHGGDLDQGEYLIYRRNMRDVTLRGDFVKSYGEKFIADYLFEHGIRYRYEERVYVKGPAKDALGSFYKPDFTIFHNQRRLRLEHWGIDENDPQKRIAPHWSGTWQEYRDQMEWKRRFWHERREVLIETSVSDLYNGRASFEEKLNRLLTDNDIQLKKLTDDELTEKVIPFHRDRMTSRFAQFIQRAKKQGAYPEEMRQRVNAYDQQDPRVSIFLDLACEVYEAYEHRKNDDKPKKERYIDFDDLLIRAAQQVQESKGECEVNLAGQGKGLPIKLNDLRCLLIDEYQDYSELFHSLVSAMQENNPQLFVAAVGDDWQSINSFAGSNLKYFRKFKEYFPGGKINNLNTNQRSATEIVKFGNEIMKQYGEPAQSRDGNPGGLVSVEFVDDVWLNLPSSESFDKNKPDDTRFLFKRPHGEPDYSRTLLSQYLRLCHDLVVKHHRESILILSRRNVLPFNLRLSEFFQKLRACVRPELRSQLNRNVKVSTAHSSKGQEADIVIILRAVNGEFPLIHPDGDLFRIFGQSASDVLAEERRLFYVASSRAKSRLYLLTERGEVADFLPRKYYPADNRWR